MQQIRIAGLVIRITGVAETGWRNKNTDIVFESRHAFMDEALDLTTTIAEHCNDDFHLLEGNHTINFQVGCFAFLSSVKLLKMATYYQVKV